VRIFPPLGLIALLIFVCAVEATEGGKGKKEERGLLFVEPFSFAQKVMGHSLAHKQKKPWMQGKSEELNVARTEEEWQKGKRKQGRCAGHTPNFPIELH
jgi:hypothetical protein